MASTPPRFLGFLAFAILVHCPSGPAQENTFPRLKNPGRYSDGSVRVVIESSAEKRASIHLDVTDARCRLFEGGLHHTDAGARLVPIASKREQAILGDLEAVLHSNFDAGERADILSRRSFRHESDKMTWRQYLEGQLLRSLHRYRRLTSARMSAIYPGKGTVRLSLKLDISGSAEQMFMFRKLRPIPDLRIYAGDATKPISLGSEIETQVVLAIGIWLRARLNDVQRAALNQKVGDVDNEVEIDANDRTLFDTFREYKRVTSPRVRNLMVARDGGSITVELTDEHDKDVRVTFDHSLGTKTPGLMTVDWGEIRGTLDIRSEQESQVLAFLDRATRIAREMPGKDLVVAALTRELNNYRDRYSRRR